MFFSLLLIALGILILLKPEFMEKMITMQNEMKGIQTKITTQTKEFHKMMGILSIIVGIILFFAP